MCTAKERKALDILDGLIEPESELEYIAAWQLLIDSGVITKLDDTTLLIIADHMIRRGICTPQDLTVH